MNRIVDDFYEIVMTGGVEGRHLSLLDERSAITGDLIRSVLKRSKVEEQTEGRDNTLALGVDSQLQSVNGAGSILIHTDTRDVFCDRFEYNLASNIAQAHAVPNGRLTIKTKDDANPIHAKSINWNLLTDSIEITRGSGSRSGR